MMVYFSNADVRPLLGPTVRNSTTDADTILAQVIPVGRALPQATAAALDGFKGKPEDFFGCDEIARTRVPSLAELCTKIANENDHFFCMPVIKTSERVATRMLSSENAVMRCNGTPGYPIGVFERGPEKTYEVRFAQAGKGSVDAPPCLMLFSFPANCELHKKLSVMAVFLRHAERLAQPGEGASNIVAGVAVRTDDVSRRLKKAGWSKAAFSPVYTHPSDKPLVAVRLPKSAKATVYPLTFFKGASAEDRFIYKREVAAIIARSNQV